MSLAGHPLSAAADTATDGGRLDRWLLSRLAARMRPARLRYALGGALVAEPDARATVRFADRRALVGLIFDPEVHFGDAFSAGRIEIEGDLVEAISEAYQAPPNQSVVPLRWLSVLGRATPRRSRANVEHHYDLGNDFYREWLDRELVYTCAYFETPEAGLEQAQIAKHDLVCRKLAIQPGETVAEAGCGWGALARHMARRYGARVTACNLSREQVAWARRRAAAEGLADRVQFLEADYRELRGRFDVFVSVGMLEHVGLRSYGELARTIDRCLDPRRGRGLLPVIGRDAPRPLNAWIRKRIFPGAYPPTLDQAVRLVLRPAHVGVVDVENLRRHYALTLDHWRRRYEAALAAGRIGFDEAFRRGWRVYLAGSQAAFATGWLDLFQLTFTRRADDTLPWTRASLYRPQANGAS